MNHVYSIKVINQPWEHLEIDAESHMNMTECNEKNGKGDEFLLMNKKNCSHKISITSHKKTYNIQQQIQDRDAATKNIITGRIHIFLQHSHNKDNCIQLIIKNTNRSHPIKHETETPKSME